MCDGSMLAANIVHRGCSTLYRDTSPLPTVTQVLKKGMLDVHHDPLFYELAARHLVPPLAALRRFERVNRRCATTLGATLGR